MHRGSQEDDQILGQGPGGACELSDLPLETRVLCSVAVSQRFSMSSSKGDVHQRVLLALVAFELLLFVVVYSREIAWYPPLNYDQAAFLSESYHAQELTLSQGLSGLWRAFWSGGHPSGVAMPIEGAVFGVLFGGTRLPQLFVLFLAFSMLQIIGFSVAHAVWRRREYGYLFVGLILCQITAWFWAGGLFDFRMDFFAYCFYGIWTCAVVRSDLFLDRRWAIGCALLGSILVLNRFLAIAYLVGISAGTAVIFVIVLFVRHADAEFVLRMRRRLSNIGISIGLLVLITAPILIRNWPAIHAYYIIGHGVSDEREVRAREVGVHDLIGHLLYYPNSIIRDHWGSIFICACAITIIAAIVFRLLNRQRKTDNGGSFGTPESALLQIVFLIGAIFGPLLVLTTDVAKSPVVGGIIGIPTALFVVSLAATIGPNQREALSPGAQKCLLAVSVLIFATGLFNFVSHATRHFPQSDRRLYFHQLTDLDNWLVGYAADRGWKDPKISFDTISGDFFAPAITATGYERSHRLIDFHTLLGGNIMGVDRTEALSYLAQSDFVVLTNAPKRGVYPFYERISQYWDLLKAWVDKNMIKTRTIALDDLTATIYVRPNVEIQGVSGNWVTSGGLTIQGSHDTLRRFPKIRLSGPANYSWLPKVPNVSATIENDADPRAIPASFERNDSSYEILIDLSQIELPQSDIDRIRLNFDTFFVPNKIGLNDDTRELVVQAPTLVQLMPK